MEKKMKIIIFIIILLTIIDFIVSVIMLNMIPLVSIFIDCILITMLFKYSKKKIIEKEKDSKIDVDVKEIIKITIIPFILLAIIITSVMYFFFIK